jgi:hypothetical protein
LAQVKVTDHRTADDFALCMRELVEVDVPEAERIRVVCDNLSTDTAADLYARVLPAAPRRVLRRLEFHYATNHASWLNMLRSRSACSMSRSPHRSDYRYFVS